MIRPITAADIDAVLVVAAETGFESGELEVLQTQIEWGVSGELGEGHHWVADEVDGRLTTVACFAAEQLADRVWNLLMLAVAEGCQRQGKGAAMLRHVEAELREQGQRLLLTETSATDDFIGARDFYRKNGYEEEARIRDYYEPGDDKIVFRKLL